GLAVTKNPEPDVTQLSDAAGLTRLRAAAKSDNTGVSILVDGERIAHVGTLTTASFGKVISGSLHPGPVDGATYHGSPIVSPGSVRCPDAFCTQFDGSDGSSQTSFR